MKRIINGISLLRQRGLPQHQRLCFVTANLAFFFLFAIATASAHINNLLPSSTTAGGPAFTLRILGTDFDEYDAQNIQFDNTPVSARLISSREIQAIIPASLIVTPRLVQVSLLGYNSIDFRITQAACPASSYSISPIHNGHKSLGSEGELTVTAPVECPWTARTDTSWITILYQTAVAGNGTVRYRVSANSGPPRNGSINIEGNDIPITQTDPDCPLRFALRDTTAPSKTLGVSRQFRDDVLASSPRGRHYTHLYYQFASEAVQMMILHPTLILRSREMLDRYLPVIEAMVKGEQPTLSDGDLTEIDEFLHALAANGSLQLRDTVKTLCEDLRDPEVLSEFGITVTPGLRRELPDHRSSLLYNPLTSLVPPLGFFIIFAAKRTSRRRFIARLRVAKHSKRLFALFIAMVVVSPWSAVSSHSRHQSLVSQQPSLKRIPVVPTIIADAWTAKHQLTGSTSGGSYQQQMLAINPVLGFSTYFGGGGADEGNSIAVDSAGNIYVTGFTDSRNFPVVNAAQAGFGGGQQDAFVIKLNPTGTQVIYATYFGGSGQDNGTAIAVDTAGNAYITGYTDSSNFPVQNALQTTKTGAFNAFVVKLSPTGALVSSTLLGGSLSDYGSSIAVDLAGGIYVAGIATSPDFPMLRAAQPAFGGLADGFVAKLNPTATRLVYSTFLGGSGVDGVSSIAIDASGNAYLTGLTESPNLPTVNALQARHGGGLFDAFVMKLDTTGERLIYSTFLGGNSVDRAFRIAVNTAGNAFVIGDTDSSNFPTLGAAQPTKRGSTDAFVTRLNAAGTALDYSTYLGGSGIDGGTAIAVDAAGSATVTGFTASPDFPLVAAAQAVYGGGYDGFVARYDAKGTALEYATYLGGGGTDSAFGVATDTAGSTYVMGVTNATNFPTAGALQTTNSGGTTDLFIAKIKFNPVIIGAGVSGKRLLVDGNGFDSGAKILIDNEPQKTVNDEQNPSTLLVGKKAGKKIAPGQSVTLQVKNSDGSLSNEFRFTRVAN
jgi:hypothetical protein